MVCRNIAWCWASLLAVGCFSPNETADTDEIGTSGEGVTTDTSEQPSSTSATSGTSATTQSSSSTSATDPTTSDSSSSLTTTEGPTSTSTEGDTGSGTSDPELCGNGELDVGEECDDGTNAGGYEGCEADCTLGPRCGDGEVQAAEGCDDGDEVQGNGCNLDCQPSGEEQWTDEAHVGADDECEDVVAASNAYIYVVARVPNLDGADDAHAFWVRRLSVSGDEEWTREYAPFADQTSHDYDPFAAADAGDGVVVVGAHRESVSTFSSYTDVPVAKFSATNGDIVWDRSDTFANIANAVISDEEGTFVIGATDGQAGDGGVYRVSAAGELVGQIDFELDEQVFGLALTDANASLAIGVTENPTGPDPSVVRARNSGLGTLWSTQLDGLTAGSAVASQADLAFAVGGTGSLGWYVRLSGAGDVDWTILAADVAALGLPRDVVAAPNGEVIVVGSRQGAPWIARLGVDGGVIWSRAPSESGSYESVDVAADGTFVACGSVNGGGQGTNIFVASYSP